MYGYFDGPEHFRLQKHGNSSRSALKRFRGSLASRYFFASGRLAGKGSWCNRVLEGVAFSCVFHKASGDHVNFDDRHVSLRLPGALVPS